LSQEKPQPYEAGVFHLQALIAQYAIAANLWVVHCDVDFERITGSTL
jgi:hypothetical protein